MFGISTTWKSPETSDGNQLIVELEQGVRFLKEKNIIC